MVNGEGKRFYVFGVFLIDVTARLLYGAKGIVPLTPKAFDTLLVLVEQRGRLVSKTELMEKVWPDSFVEENNLAQQVFALRKALREEGGGRNYIETLPKRGYRFTAEVTEGSEEAYERPQAASDHTTQTDPDEHQPIKSSSSLKDVVIIGRAIDFK